MRRGIKLSRTGLIIYSVIAIAAFAAIALVIMHFVAQNGLYPEGPDALYHVYRGELVYNGIAEGNWYPLYDPDWYNGVEIMRYYAPLCPYFYALCMAIAKPFFLGSFGGYLVFVMMIFFLGAIVWFVIGRIMDRPFLGTIIAVLWFFVPNNLYALFGMGDLSRALCMVFLPIFFFSVYQYLNIGKMRYLPICTISFMLIALSDLKYALLVIISFLIYLLIDILSFGRYLRTFRLILAAAFGFLLTGIWTIPRLFGGISTVQETENTREIFQKLFTSMDPLNRVNNGPSLSLYFGLAAVILALFGGFLSYKKERSGFWFGLILLLLTTETAHNLIKLIPGGSVVSMLQAISIAACVILLSFMAWRTLKKPIILFMVIIMMADTIPSLPLLYGDGSDHQPEERLSVFAENTLIEKAKSITRQRLCILDEGNMESAGAYVPVSGPGGVKIASGVGRNSSEIDSNIVNINRGVSGQAYTYVFDRALELGNDTVLLYLPEEGQSRGSEVDVCAARSGYKPIASRGRYRLYSLDKSHPDTWGVITEYKAIAIGNGANIIARQFPYFREGRSLFLDDYAFDDLKGYEIIYLTSFEFRDRSYAEDLIVKLSEAGVRIIISADGVPEDRNVNGRVFLGVVCNPISFSQGFPILNTIEGDLDTDLFPAESREWGTYFCDGLDKTWGKVKDESYDIPFLGTVKNDKIIFVGLNLTYYYGITRDKGVEKLLSKVMSLSTTELPDRQIVPLEVSYEPDKITIVSDYDNVNTTLAYHNFFNLEKRDYEDNHLLYVSKGVTEIYLAYPYLAAGLICTLLSALMAVGYYLLLHVKEAQRRKTVTVSHKAEDADDPWPKEDEDDPWPKEDEDSPWSKEDEDKLSDEEFEKVQDRYNRIGCEYLDVDSETDYDYDFDYDLKYETNHDKDYSE